MESHLKKTMTGYFIEKVLFEPKESEYMKFDEAICSYNSDLQKEFPYLKKFDSASSTVLNNKYYHKFF